MDKKVEKEIDVKLKPENDSVRLTEEPSPELVVTDGADADVAAADLADADLAAADVAVADLADAGSEAMHQVKVNEGVSRDGKNTPSAPPNMTGDKTVQKSPPQRSFDEILKHPLNRTALVLVVALLAVGPFLLEGWKWYRHAPRVDRENSETMIFSPLAAWIGNADAAYAMQLLPLMTDRSSTNTGSNNTSENPPSSRYLEQTRSGQRKIAFTNLERFTRQSPEQKPISVLALATALGTEGKPREAANILRTVADTSKNPLMKGYVGMFLIMAGELPAALTEFDRGLALSTQLKGTFPLSGIYALYTMKAQILQAMGRPAEALSLLDSADCEAAQKDSYSGHDAVLQSKAAIYLQMGDADKAIVLLCQCKELNHSMLSTAYLMKGDYEDALTHANENNLTLSRIYSQRGKLEEALKYAEAADKRTVSLVAREQHVYVLNQLQRYSESLSISQDLHLFEKFSSMISDPMQARVQLHADRALAFAKLGDAKNALIEANRAFASNKNSATALQAAQLASQRIGDTVNASKYAERLSQLKFAPSRPIFISDSIRY